MDLREIVNGLMYTLSTGCQWLAISKACHRATFHDYFDLWSWDGTFDRIYHALYVECYERAERSIQITFGPMTLSKIEPMTDGSIVC